MEAPYTIAALPSPLNKEYGGIHGAPVHALKGSKKRKRHEVAVAVDGEGISIYNVQTQSLITSYAVPPQTYFCGRPCSIFCRASVDKPAARMTYIATKNAPKSESQKLACFASGVRGQKGADGEFPGPKKSECMIPSGDICGLDAVASPSGEVTCIAVAYTDGRLRFVNSDLTKTQEDRAAFKAKSATELEFSIVVDLEGAKKGLLKGREDVLAAMDVTGSGSVRGGLLCQIARTNGHRRFQLLLLQGHDQSGLQSKKGGVEMILDFELPNSSGGDVSQAQHDLHASSGKLFSLISGKLVVYDLGGLLPKVCVQLGNAADPISSFARLSTSMLIATSTTTATVYEIAYGSLQAAGSLQMPTTSSRNIKKRKRDSNDFGGIKASVAAISAFPELGLFVFLAEGQLAAMQLGEEVLNHARGKDRTPRLTNVLGQGTSRRILKIGQGVRDDEKISDWAKQVDDLIEDNDVQGLESLVANDEALGRQRKPEKKATRSEEDDDAHGDAAAYDDLWPLPEPLDPTKLDRQRTLYILSKVFSYAPDEPQIEIRIASRKLLEWLALAGQLNRRALEKAVTPDNAGVQREPIQPGDIMTAIAEIDDEFQLMHGLLSLPAQWELPEMIQAMCLLIRSFDSPAEATEPLEPKLALLGAPDRNADEAMTDGDIAMTNGDDADSHVESESKAAETELEHVERVLMSGLEVRSGTLRVILERLHAFPARDVTKAMRAMMTQKELIFLIHMLRIELADGGWTSRYAGAGADEERYEGPSDPLLASMVDVIPVDGETGPSNQAIRAIGDLLNCAVDAVGTSGWLVGLSGDALGTEELLDSLRAEVSAGLEGCYEANTLGTFLAELERFVASKPNPRKGVSQEAVNDAALPVGGRAELLASRGKKSKHVLAMEKSKKVGKYSLDRIRF